MRLSARRKSGAAVTRGDLTMMAWRKAKTSSKSSVMVANVLAVACFALPFFFLFSSSDSTPLSLSFYSSLSSLLDFSPSFAHSVIEQAKIFKSLPTSDSPLRIAASVNNFVSRTALRVVQSQCFFKCVRLPAAAQRRT